jgi:hypothetical protein
MYRGTNAIKKKRENGERNRTENEDICACIVPAGSAQRKGGSSLNPSSRIHGPRIRKLDAGSNRRVNDLVKVTFTVCTGMEIWERLTSIR